MAAIAYALGSDLNQLLTGRRKAVPGPRTWWPWDLAALKLTPDDRVRELAKAGALIAAAIDVELAEIRETIEGIPSDSVYNEGDEER